MHRRERQRYREYEFYDRRSGNSDDDVQKVQCIRSIIKSSILCSFVQCHHRYINTHTRASTFIKFRVYIYIYTSEWYSVHSPGMAKISTRCRNWVERDNLDLDRAACSVSAARRKRTIHILITRTSRTCDLWCASTLNLI